MPNPVPRAPLSLFFVLFVVSGFAGLIYQSIWSHYLKLFLGHAAHAQTLVLVMFMGGMAIGAWLISRFTHRLKKLLLAYALVELLVGILALTFHPLFVAVIDVSYGSVLPQLAGTGAEPLYKWLIAALLILPQSILLGTTFPLMSGGVVRTFRALPGASVSGLYFTNSLGAAIGVLVAGFYLINRVGLPGTLMTAGLLNIGLAIALWALSKQIETADANAEIDAMLRAPGISADAATIPSAENASPSLRLMLLVALATGAITFIYEIAWIRMLSLVLGSSTHSFELMLSAMIFGIAFGSLWIKRRIDAYHNLLIVLGVVLCLKGLFAVATLPLYMGSFDVMHALFHALNKTPFAYGMYNVAGQVISMSVMVPSAFFAGMSLPLITMYLYRKGHGESVIGRVYAWNTLGAIIGVAIAVHLGLVYLGLKNLVIAAALVDVAIAIALVATSRHLRAKRAAIAIGCAALAVFGISGGLVKFDDLKLASGVYRDGNFYAEDSTRVIFQQDGKTARITVLDHTNGTRSIGTNGKTDASIQMNSGAPPESDEFTMTLAAAVPLAYRPDAKRVANIGFGSGLTTHALLGHSGLKTVDSIEIEPMMVEGAKQFGERVARAYTDPRSHLHFDDAKSFFATQTRGYDIIISEPSNPWISGVATLFSDEFYGRVKTHLNQDGILVQWIQLYEIDLELVASIMKSLHRNFGDYAIYDLQGSEMLIVATNSKALPPLSGALFAEAGMRGDLARIGIADLNQLASWKLAGRATLAPLFDVAQSPKNSDYFPVVDQNAARARFLERKATVLTDILIANAPVVDILEGRVAASLPLALREPRDMADSLRYREQRIAYRIRDYLLEGSQRAGVANLPQWQVKVAYFNRGLSECKWLTNDPIWSEALFEIGVQMAKHVAPNDANDVWHRLDGSACAKHMSVRDRQWRVLFGAVGERAAAGILTATTPLWDQRDTLPAGKRDYLLELRMASAIAVNQPAEAINAWNAPRRGTPPAVLPLNQRLLLAHLMLAQRSRLP